MEINWVFRERLTCRLKIKKAGIKNIPAFFIFIRDEFLFAGFLGIIQGKGLVKDLQQFYRLFGHHYAIA